VDYRSDLEPSARSTLTRDLVVEALAYYNKCGQFLCKFIKKASERFRADSRPAQEMMKGEEEETFL
jgi:hypothetical protein